MSMDPRQFHDLLDRAVADEAPAAPGAVARDVATGERLLRRRRRGAAIIGSAALAAVVTGLSVIPATDLWSGPREAPPAADPGALLSDTRLVESCRDGNVGDRATAAMFGSGDPAVKAVSRTDHQVMVALESPDGRHWAECFVHLTDQEFSSGMTVWAAEGTAADSSYTSGSGCGLVDGEVDPTCRTFSVAWVDRRPDAVAAVEFTTGDGRTTTVPSRDGYIVFNYLGDLPDGVRTSDGGGWSGFQPLRRVTFLDADGTPIAAEAQDGSGDGPDGERVGDLPSIRSYPGLRSAEVR